MYMCVLLASVCADHMWVSCPWTYEKDIRSTRPGHTGSNALPYGCWNLNPCPLLVLEGLLTTEISFSPQTNF